MNQTQSQSQGSGLAPNVAAPLCYVCPLFTGIIFLILEKENQKVRFHAWQALMFGVTSIVVQIGFSILGAILGAIASFLGAILAILSPIVWLVFFVFWIVCMVKAYQGEQYKLPLLGDMAEKQAAKG